MKLSISSVIIEKWPHNENSYHLSCAMMLCFSLSIVNMPDCDVMTVPSIQCSIA